MPAGPTKTPLRFFEVSKKPDTITNTTPVVRLLLTDQEKELFDTWAVEHVGIAGVTIDYFSINPPGSRVDPVYREPLERRFEGPYRVHGHLTYPEHVPSTGEEGLRTRWDAEAWIPRKVAEEAAMPLPTNCDVIRVWNIPFYHRFSVDDFINVPGSNYYFDVLDADDDGHIFDQPTFVGYKLKLARRAEFTPERRVSPP
jgi:hypothetical protein